MAESDDDLSVIVLADDSSSLETSYSPDLRINISRNRPAVSDKSGEDSEIRQAHTALNTAYHSLKTKLNKVENENKGLKALLRKHETINMSFSTSQTGENGTPPQNGGLQLPSTNVSRPEATKHHQNGLLRRHSARLSEENQHRRHGSWAHFNDVSSPSGEQYVKFMEMQIESTEKERNVLKAELEQLRLR